MKSHLDEGQRRKVWSCSLSGCDGAIMVLFKENEVTQVAVLNSDNRWVPVANGLHPHQPVVEKRKNPNWDLPKVKSDSRLSAWDVLPDGTRRGAQEQYRMTCSCGVSSAWQPYGRGNGNSNHEREMEIHWVTTAPEPPIEDGFGAIPDVFAEGEVHAIEEIREAADGPCQLRCVNAAIDAAGYTVGEEAPTGPHVTAVSAMYGTTRYIPILEKT
jgi:hypothetical protein